MRKVSPCLHAFELMSLRCLVEFLCILVNQIVGGALIWFFTNHQAFEMLLQVIIRLLEFHFLFCCVKDCLLAGREDSSRCVASKQEVTLRQREGLIYRPEKKKLSNVKGNFTP